MQTMQHLMKRIENRGLNPTKSESDQQIRFGCDDEVLRTFLIHSLGEQREDFDLDPL